MPWLAASPGSLGPLWRAMPDRYQKKWTPLGIVDVSRYSPGP